jgi:hypothetical protein
MFLNGITLKPAIPACRQEGAIRHLRYICFRFFLFRNPQSAITHPALP